MPQALSARSWHFEESSFFCSSSDLHYLKNVLAEYHFLSLMMDDSVTSTITAST
jgi:hypothetical protein